MSDKKEGKGKEKKAKPQAKPEAKDSEDFVQLVRLAGVVVDGNLTLPKALMKVKGIGPRVAEALIPKLNYPVDVKVGSLKEEQIEDIEKRLEGVDKIVPTWMLNRRNDVESGTDMHRLGPELDMVRRNDINREKKIKSYRGMRHSLNQPVRGQRTRSSFRSGSTIGVKRKRGK